MRPRTAVLAALTATTLFGVTSAVASPGYPPGQPLDAGHAYLLTQQHRDNLSWWNGTWVPQTIPDRAHVQVQLPSNPIRWVPDLGPTCHPSPVADLVPSWLLPLRGTVELLGTSTLPNNGRVAGTSEIAVFDYRVSGLGIAVLCLRPDPVPTDPGQIGFPPGTPPDFVVTLIVGVPQLALP